MKDFDQAYKDSIRGGSDGLDGIMDGSLNGRGPREFSDDGTKTDPVETGLELSVDYDDLAVAEVNSGEEVFRIPSYLLDKLGAEALLASDEELLQ